MAHYEAAETPEKGCQNCGPEISHAWYYLTQLFTAEGEFVTLCHECADELRREEALAEQMAAMPSCEARTQIIDTAQTTGNLVSRLRAHDLAQCAQCASTRKTVASDRELLDPAAVCCEGREAA